jgi:hypothetical protein
LEDYERLLKEFFSSPGSLSAVGIAGSASAPVEIDYSELKLAVMSMDFFDRLQDNGRTAQLILRLF